MENNTTQPTQPTVNSYPPAPQDPTPTHPLPRHMPKTIAIIAIILLLILLLSGAALGIYNLGKKSAAPTPTPTASNTPTPTPDPTANWQTYQGNGFILKYPPNWTEVKIDNLVRFFPPGSKPESEFTTSGKSEYIQIFADTSDPKVCRGDCPPSGTMVDIEDLSNINPANYKTSEGLIGGMCACEVDKIYLKNGNSYYTLGLYGITDTQKTPPNISSENEMVFQQILSTFKFTDPETSMGISENVFDVTNAKMGDSISGLEIISISPYKPSFGAISETNAIVGFLGRRIITGKYTKQFGQICMNDLENPNLPQIKGDSRDLWFCFEQSDTLSSFFPNNSGNATVEIDNYTINTYPSEVWNTARFMKKVN